MEVKIVIVAIVHNRLGASVSVIREKFLEGGRRKRVVEVLVRKIQEDHKVNLRNFSPKIV